jgi:hypothetical protein
MSVSNAESYVDQAKREPMIKKRQRGSSSLAIDELCKGDQESTEAYR